MCYALDSRTVTEYEAENIARRQRIKRLHEKGMSVLEIARELGVTRQAIYQHLKRLDLSPPTRKETQP